MSTLKEGQQGTLPQQNTYKRIGNVRDKRPANPDQIRIAWETDSEVAQKIVRTDVCYTKPETGEQECLDAYYLDGVLTENECNQLIQATESIGYTYWDPAGGGSESYRNVDTIEVTHHEITSHLFNRIKHEVRQRIEISEEDEVYEVDIGGQWDVSHVNPLCLFGRYDGNGHFAPHTDGVVIENVNSRTFYTVLVFLKSTDNGGGETYILDNNMISMELPRNADGVITALPEQILAKVEPQPGRVLLFFFDRMHEGSIVLPNHRKYIIRTDLFYKRVNPILTSETDQAAFQLWLDAQHEAETGSADKATEMFKKAIRMSPGLKELYRM